MLWYKKLILKKIEFYDYSYNAIKLKQIKSNYKLYTLDTSLYLLYNSFALLKEI